jgi:hypothetical protein
MLVCAALVGIGVLTNGAASAAPTAGSCTLQSATPIRVEDVLKDYRPYLDKCVRMHGFIASRRFFDSIESFYRFSQGSSRLPKPGYIALYGSTSVSQDWLWDYRAGVDIAGTISACELIDTASDNPNQIVMVIGECHYRGGPLIHATELRPDLNAPRRLAGNQAREKFGHLTPVDATAIPGQRRQIIERWLDAIRKRDTTTMARLANWRSNHVFDDAVNPIRSPYWSIIGRPYLPTVHYFLTRPNEPNEGWTVGCVCTVADCSRDWPISEGDASPDAAWPYVCTVVDNFTNTILY